METKLLMESKLLVEDVDCFTDAIQKLERTLQEGVIRLKAIRDRYRRLHCDPCRETDHPEGLVDEETAQRPGRTEPMPSNVAEVLRLIELAEAWLSDPTPQATADLAMALDASDLCQMAD